MSLQVNYERYLEQVKHYFECAGDTERRLASLSHELKAQEEKLRNQRDVELEALNGSQHNLESKFYGVSESLQIEGFSAVVSLPKKVRGISSTESLDSLVIQLKDCYKELEVLKKNYKLAVEVENNQKSVSDSARIRREAALAAQRAEQQANDSYESPAQRNSGCLGASAILLLCTGGLVTLATELYLLLM